MRETAAHRSSASGRFYQNQNHNDKRERDMRLQLIGGASLIALALTGAPAFAQAVATDGPRVQDATEVGEVVVTARKREERLRDVPESATVLDASHLEARGGITNVDALLSNAPAVRFANTGTPATSEISIRNSGTARATSAEASVGLYRDGSYIGGGNIGGRSFARVDLFDVDRAEVLRGPQGALYGRNAVGGAINIVSAKPTTQQEGFVDVNYGVNTQKSEVQLVVNQPLSDFVSVRLGVDWIDQDKGFAYNPDNDLYADREAGLITRGQIRLDKEGLDLNLLVERQTLVLPALYYSFAIPPGATGYPLGLTGPKYSFPLSTPPSAKQAVDNVNFTANLDLDWATLAGTASYRTRDSYNQFDTDAMDAALYTRERARGNVPLGTDYEARALTLEENDIAFVDLHLAGAKRGALTWLAGYSFLKSNNDYTVLSYRTPTVANKSVGTTSPANTKLTSNAAYLSLGYDLSPTLNITGEGRYSSDERELHSNRFDRGTGVQQGARYIRDLEDSGENFSYTLALAYKFSPGWLAYAKAGSGFRSGGFNSDGGDSRAPKPVPASYDDEKSLSYEVGAKGNLLRNLYVTVAAYKTIVTDFLVQDDNGCAATNPVCPVLSTSFLINAGEAHITGIELEGNSAFDVLGGVLHLNLGISHQSDDIVEGPYKGRSVPQAPEWTGSANIDYRRTFANGVTAFTNVNYAAQAGGVQEIVGTPILYDHGVWDLRLGVRKDGWEAAAYAKNATNESYVLFASTTLQRWSPPRLYGVQLRRRW